jgi:hypothetical protein
LFPQAAQEDCVRALSALVRRVNLIGVTFADHEPDGALIALMGGAALPARWSIPRSWIAAFFPLIGAGADADRQDEIRTKMRSAWASSLRESNE